jgi:CHAD domain-containing protein
VTRTSVNVEREVKLSATPEYRLPDLHELGLATEQLPAQTLSTSYFDTEDLRLWQRRITLRHRLGEGDKAGMWTLKLQGESAHDEVNRTELSWPGHPDDIAPEALRLLRGIVRRQALERVVVLESTRRRVLVRMAGSALGEIDDDTVTVTDGGRAGHTFRQIEFEIDSEVEGSGRDVSAIESVVAAIKAAGAHIESEQKFAKALGIASDHRGSPEAAVGRTSTLGTLVRWSLRSEFETLLEFDVNLRREPEDPPVRAIHQARVATRRLRSDLKTFSPILDPVWLRHTRAELKWMGGVLGAVRDVDVLDKRLESRDTGPVDARGTDALRAALASQRRNASEDLAEALRSERYLNLLDRLDAGTTSPRFYVNPPPGQEGGNELGPDAPARTALPRLLRPHWKTLRRRVKKAGTRPSDTQLHRIRIGSKQLRYGAELAEPVLGKPARRTARRAEEMQTILGEHHDAVTAVDWLERIPAGGTTMASFAAGSATADARREQSTARRQWEQTWKALKKGTRTAWLQ